MDIYRESINLAMVCLNETKGLPPNAFTADRIRTAMAILKTALFHAEAK